MKTFALRALLLLAPLFAGPVQAQAAPDPIEADQRQLLAWQGLKLASTQDKQFRPGCVPVPFPTTPSGAQTSGTAAATGGSVRFTFWHQPCAGGGQQLLLTLQPASGTPFVCSGAATLVQGGRQYQRPFFNPSPAPALESVCGTLFVPTAVWLDARGIQAATPFNDAEAFEFIYQEGVLPVLRVSVPAAQGAASPTPAITLGTRTNGTWYEPSMPGQGWFFEAHEPSGTFIFSRFTWRAESASHDWYTGVGTFQGDQAEVTLYRSSGGRFVNAAPVTTVPAGSATLRFRSCSRARLDYSFEDGRSGSLDIQRLSPLPAGC